MTSMPEEISRSGRFILYNQLHGMLSATTMLAQIQPQLPLGGVTLLLLRRLEGDFRNIVKSPSLDGLPVLVDSETMSAMDALVVVGYWLNTLASFLSPDEAAEAGKLGF